MIQCATWSGGESVEASPTSNAGDDFAWVYTTFSYGFNMGILGLLHTFTI
jgi:hypothetical protein